MSKKNDKYDDHLEEQKRLQQEQQGFKAMFKHNVVGPMALGFVAWLPIGLFLEIIGIDLLVGTTIYTHFYEYLGAIIVVGLPIHYFIWKIK